MTNLAMSNDFNKLADAVVRSRQSESGKHMYQKTYDDWASFAFAENFEPLDITFERVDEFVHMPGKSKTTMQNRLSHMCKLLELRAVLDGRYERHYKTVKSFLKIRSVKGLRTVRRALTSDEVSRLFDSFNGDDDYAIRNQALIRVAVYTGARRSELARMRWADIDMDKCVITISNGKGNRVVEALDKTDGTRNALSRLRDRQAAVIGPCEFVFTKVAKFKRSFTSCERIADSTVYHLVRSHAEAAGIGRLTPHDLRRTYIGLPLKAHERHFYSF